MAQVILEGIKEVSGMLEEYRQSLAKLVDNSKEIDELTQEMTESAAAINKGSAAMKSDLLADQKRLEAESDATVAETERLILMLAAGGFLFGCVWAFFLGKGISRPMTAMCNAMRKLAAGNFEVVLPGLGRKDELTEVYDTAVHWADVFLVATPIRWGAASSLYYKMVERMNCIQNQITIRNKVLMRDKVAA